MASRNPAPESSDTVPADVPFEDGLGIRVRERVDGEPVERLIVCDQLAQLENALRDRMGRLANFRHVRYPRIRGVERVGSGDQQAVSVVSDLVPGVRFAEVLRFVEHAPETFDVNAALQVARELLPALAVLHDSRNVTHGALGPERIVLGPQSRVVIVDHGLGLALERLRYPRSRLWKEFRVAMPPSAGLPQFDQRADVAQVALTVLALVLGRALAPKEFPDGVRGLLASAPERLAGGATRPMTASLRAWFERALPLETRRPLATAVEAQIALEDVITREVAYAPRPGTLRTFFERYQGRLGGAAGEPATGRGARGGGRRGTHAEKPGENRRGRHRAVQQTQEELEAAELRRLEEELARLTQQELEASASPAAVAPPPGPSADVAETRQPASPRRVVRIRGPEDGEHGTPAAVGRPVGDETQPLAPEARDTEAPDAPQPTPLAVLPFPFVVLSPPAPADDATAVGVTPATVDGKGQPGLVGTDARPAASDEEVPQPAEATLALDEEFSLDAELDRLVAGAGVDDPPGAAEEPWRIESGDPGACLGDAGTPADVATDPNALAVDLELAELEAVVAAAVAAEAARTTPPHDETVPGPVFDLAAPDDAGPAVGTALVAREEEEEEDGGDGPHERWTLTPPPIDGVPPSEEPLEPAAESLKASSRMDELPFDAEPEPDAITGLPAPLWPFQPTLAGAAARGVQPLMGVPEVQRVIGARPRWLGTQPRRAVPVVRGPVPRRPAALAAAPEPLGWLAAEAEPVEARLAVVAATDVLAVSEPAAVVEPEAVAPMVPMPAPQLEGEGCEAPAEASLGVVGDEAAPALTAAIELVDAPDVSAVSSDDTLDALLDLLVSDLHASSVATSEELQPDAEPAATAAGNLPVAGALEALGTLGAIPGARGTVGEDQASAADARAGEPDASPAPIAGVPADAAPRDADVLGPEAEQPATPVEDTLDEHGTAPAVVAQPPLVAEVEPDAAPVPSVGVPADAAFRDTDVLEPEAAQPPTSVEDAVDAYGTAPAAAAQPPFVAAVEPDANIADEVVAADDIAVGTPADLAPPQDAGADVEVLETAWVDEDTAAVAAESLCAPAARPTAARPAAEEAARPPVLAEVPAVASPAVEPAVSLAPHDEDAAVTLANPAKPRRRRRKRRSSRPAVTPSTPAPAAVPPEIPAAPIIAPWLRGKVSPPPEPVVPAASAASDGPPLASDVGIAPAVVALPPWARRERDQAPPPDLVSIDAGEARSPETVVVAPIAAAPDETLPPIPDRTPIESPAREADGVRPADDPSSARVLPFGRRGDVRVHWKRVMAASLVLMVIEGAAFATAYWYVKPKEMGFLWIRSSVPGVAVMVDGQARGRTPVGLELPPGRHTLEMRGFGAAKVLPVEIAANVETTQLVAWPKPRRVGTLRVTSTPTGARVLLDGEPRGVTPLAVEQVAAGTHALVVEGPAGSVEQPVEVEADGTVTVDVPIYSGWLAVFAPIEVRIFLQGKLLGTSLDGRLLVPPGKHQLELINPALGYREQRTVTVTPGRVTALSVEAPRGTIVVDAPDGTDVSVDGQPVGTTPVGELPVAIGTREIVFRHPQLGQRRVTVTVGVDVPARVSMLRPGE